MEELRIYDEGDYYRGLQLHVDERHSQFQDFSADYPLEEETHFCAISSPESRFSQDELGCLYDVDFASFWAQVEEEDRKNKEGDCEKALIRREACTGSVKKGAEMQGRSRNGPERKALTFELVSQHFSMPIKQAARELDVGVTVLKKRCRELGIPRWPYRKVKSIQTLISNVQELTAQEDGHLIRSVVESLRWTKKLIEERPEVMLDEKTKGLRQVCFKETFKRRRRLMVLGNGTW